MASPLILSDELDVQERIEKQNKEQTINRNMIQIF
jgi:hypothetical protein